MATSMRAVRRLSIALAVAVSATGFLCSSAPAADLELVPPVVVPQSGGPLAFGLTLGTLGLGLEASARASSTFVFRLNGGGYSYKGNKDYDSNTFGIDTRLITLGVTADWHPFASGFRMSAGARYHDLRLSGSATSATNTVIINGNTYSFADIGALHANVTGNKVGPYLGLGYDSSHFLPGNFTLSFDIGAIYLGNPQVALSTDRTIGTLQADLRAEEQKLQDSIKYLRAYPVLTFAAKYVF